MDRTGCDAMGPEVTALSRGELTPAEEAAVRAHVAACPACAALAADAARIRAAAAARAVPPGDPAARTRLAAALDRAVAEADALERSRGPVARFAILAGRRWSESRKVRFLSYSLAVHAAAAVFLAVRLSLLEGPTRPEVERVTEVAVGEPLPPPYDDPLAPGTLGEPSPRPPAPVRIPIEVDTPWPMTGGSGPSREPGSPFPDPPETAGGMRLYPGEEFRAFAAPRFRSDRATRLAAAWGPVEGKRAALTVERGMQYLARVQDADGTWASGRDGDPKDQRDRFRGGVTGICTLAFLGDGRTARRPGDYAVVVRSALTALVRSQDPKSGLLGAFGPPRANDRPLCNHAPALEALAEAYGLDYGMLPRETRDMLAGVVDRAVKATVDAQLADGSFGYKPGAAHGDSSVTLMQVEALEAARRAGFKVDAQALRRAGAWIAQRIGEDGRVGYRTPGDRSQDATLTAQALPHAASLGIPEDVRARMAGAVAAEAKTGALDDRILFRAALLEAVAGSHDPESRAQGPAAARSANDSQEGTGSLAAGRDRYAAAAGDALATARTVRALTAPYRATK
jgi:hypothetical protein